MGSIERVRLRYGWTIVAANFFGGAVVFLLLTFVLPGPSLSRSTQQTVRWLSGAVFVGSAAVIFPLGWVWSARAWRAAFGWLAAGRGPNEHERELTVRFPLTQQRIVAVIWICAALVFTGINLPFSPELASNVFEGVLLGGLATCALGFLLGERILRPAMARALADGMPSRPRLPGVAARTLLTWTLATGVVLVGIASLAIGGLHEARHTRERLSVAVLALSIVGIVVGLVTTVRLARSLADPIANLRDAMGGVERGDLEQHVAVDDGSEIGLLQAGFNRMVTGLRERERLRDLFGRQVGEDVVRHALEHGVTLGGEAREAAVLFVDLVGSTSLASSREPTEVVSALNAFFGVVVEVVAAQEGWVNKFEGDAALCVFGAPIEDPQAATRALAAARELSRRLAAELPGLRAGIGVSAGRVVAGNVGAARRFEYTVIGDPVNEAARLTELAKRSEVAVLASGAALQRADPSEAGRWVADGELVLRGRPEPTRVYGVERACGGV